MQQIYEYNVQNPNFDSLGYVTAVANLEDKRDRSAPSDFHWKILKCRMIIFSTSSILACPDKSDAKQVHIIFNKLCDDYDKLYSLFLKFSLLQSGGIREVMPEMFQMCFQYTLLAKLAPQWNIVGYNYLINNRDFLTTDGPQDGVKFNISSNENVTVLQLKPVKIHFIKRSDQDYQHGGTIRVLPSLNKAVVVDCSDTIGTAAGSFKSYKDLRRHWKNIHGYRLPEEEGSYCAIQFWRGGPMTYPKLCVTRDFPIITTVPKPTEKVILARFVNNLKAKMSSFIFINNINMIPSQQNVATERLSETQAVSLCTPTQQLY